MKTSIFAYFIKFRRAIAATCAGLAALTVIGVLTGPRSGETVVVVASHEIGPGTVLASTDLIESTLTTESPWQGLFTKSDGLIGRTTSHALAAGQPLGRSDIVSTDLLRGLKPGTVAVEISPTQISNTSMLQAGNHIDLYATNRDSDTTAALIAHDVVVLAQGNQDSSGTSMGSLSTSTQTTGVMVGIMPSQAKKLAASMNNSHLVAVVLNP